MSEIDQEFIANWYDYYNDFIGAKVRWIRGDYGEEIDLPIEIETIGIITLKIDDVSIWNKFLSSREAEFLYNFHKNTDLIREAKTTF